MEGLTSISFPCTGLLRVQQKVTVTNSWSLVIPRLALRDGAPSPRPPQTAQTPAWRRRGWRDTTHREHCVLKPKRDGGQSGQRHHFETAGALHDTDDGAQPLAALDPGGHPRGQQPPAHHVGDGGAEQDAHHHQPHAQHEAVQVAGGHVEHDVAPAAGEGHQHEAHDEEQDAQQRVQALGPEQQVLQGAAGQRQGGQTQRGQHAPQRQAPAPAGAAEAAAAPAPHLGHTAHRAAARGAARRGRALSRQLRGRGRAGASGTGAGRGGGPRLGPAARRTAGAAQASVARPSAGLTLRRGAGPAAAFHGAPRARPGEGETAEGRARGGGERRRRDGPAETQTPYRLRPSPPLSCRGAGPRGEGRGPARAVPVAPPLVTHSPRPSVTHGGEARGAWRSPQVIARRSLSRAGGFPVSGPEPRAAVGPCAEP